MRLAAKIGVALAVAVVATPAIPAEAVRPVYSFGQAVSATIYFNMNKRNIGDQFPALAARMDQAMQTMKGDSTQAGSWWNWFAYAGKRLNWLPVRPWYGYPPQFFAGEEVGPYKVDEGHFNGGSIPGVIGDLECHEMEIDEDPAGYPLVPAMGMYGSQGIKQGEMTYFSQTPHKSADEEAADSPMAAALWGIHQYNIGRPKNRWFGLARIDRGRYDFRAASHIDIATGNIIRYTGTFDSPSSNPGHWNIPPDEGGSKPCPPEGMGSDDEIDFYSFSKRVEMNAYYYQDGCTFYVKNYDLSPSGYGLATHIPMVSKGTSVWTEYVNSHPNMKFCPIAAEFIRLIADGIARAVMSDNTWQGAPYERIDVSDVRVVGGQPTGQSLLARPNEDLGYGPPAGPLQPPSPGEPPPGYQPPDRTPGGGDGGNGPVGDGSEFPGVDLSHPEVEDGDWTPPEIGMPNWLPDLPSFEIPTGSGECPRFGFSAFGTQHTMESHCGFFEQGAPTIASIMLIVFAFGAMTIVMRA